MGNLLKNNNITLTITLLLSLVFLSACNDKSGDDFATISASIQGSGAQKIKTNNIRFGKHELPAGMTRVDFSIVDSAGAVVNASIAVSPVAETINLRVAPHRNLTVFVNVYAGNVLSFEGEAAVSALRPGQNFAVDIELNPVAGTVDQPVILSVLPNTPSVLEGEFGEKTSLIFTATLSGLANGDVTFDYATQEPELNNAVANIDYIPVNGSVIIPAGELSATIEVVILGDLDFDFAFRQELQLAFTNVTTNVSLDLSFPLNQSVDFITISIFNDDFIDRINDTGTLTCGNSEQIISLGPVEVSDNKIDCAVAEVSKSIHGIDINGDLVPAGQDALIGRDVTKSDNNNGRGGFNFSRLDIVGNVVQNVPSWDCVRDNYTGLTWEAKSESNFGLRSVSDQFTWYNSTGINDGGNPGTQDSGFATCLFEVNCNTEEYIRQISQIITNDLFPFCGVTGWRLPTAKELLSLVSNDFVLGDPPPPMIENGFFQNTAAGIYWTLNSLAAPALIDSAWAIDFSTGEMIIRPKATENYVRLVSDRRSLFTPLIPPP